MKKVAVLVAGTLVAVFLALPATLRAEIVDLLTFQSAVDAAQAVDPTLRPPANDGEHDFAVGGFERFQIPRSSPAAIPASRRRAARTVRL